MGFWEAFFLGAQIGAYLTAAGVGIVNSPAYQEWQDKQEQEQTRDVYVYDTADGITTAADVGDVPETVVCEK
ncbi:MAG: hypothetical protein J6X53_06735 [Abditibacteriota bacterium]|nr:hypothetical protein [Abditibacteriota bacterium]